MSVIAVVNRKGGSGKSTIATNIAAYLAGCGHDVMLGDVDRQQSSRLWLGLRPDTQAKIQGWTIDERNFARPPAGVKHVVLDTPGGFQGIGLMKVAMYTDAILLPATQALFDRQAAADCLKELRTYPRVVLGKCRIASIGMRIDARTRNGALLADWAAGLDLEHLGTIKEAQLYARCLEQGLSVFDFPPARVETYLPEWAMLKRWVEQILAAPALAPVQESQRPDVERLRAPVRPVLASVAMKPGAGRALAPVVSPAPTPSPSPSSSPSRVPAFLTG